MIHVLSRSHRRRVLWPRDWWDIAGGTCLGAYAPDDASSLANSYVNLVSPGTDDLSVTAAPAWTSGTGWVCDGNDALVANFLATNVGTMVVRISNGAIGVIAPCGIINAGKSLRILSSFNGTHNYDSGSFVAVTGNIASGVLGIAGQQGYLNGAADGAAIATGAGKPASSISVCNAVSDVATRWFTGNIHKIVFYSTVLDASQMRNLYDAMVA